MEIHRTAIITAAGESRRMKTEKGKLFLEIGKQAVIERTLKIFDKIEKIKDMILVIRKEDEDLMASLIKKLEKPCKLVLGGRSREESTYNGLMALSEECDLVLCHDGARPFITPEIINQVIEEAQKADGAIVAVPVKDTIKVVDNKGFVDFTPNRDLLFQVQTPQVFKKEIILMAYEKIKEEQLKVTDDSSLVEIMGKKVKIVPGSYENIKITTIEDIYLGEQIINKEAVE